MKNNTAPIRQALACGFEPPIASATPWTPAGFKDPKPTTCAGYTTRLPEVIEGARAATWKADLPTFCGGEQPSQSLVYAVEINEGERNACDRWWFEEDRKK